LGTQHVTKKTNKLKSRKGSLQRQLQNLTSRQNGRYRRVVKGGGCKKANKFGKRSAGVVRNRPELGGGWVGGSPWPIKDRNKKKGGNTQKGGSENFAVVIRYQKMNTAPVREVAVLLDDKGQKSGRVESGRSKSTTEIEKKRGTFNRIGKLPYRKVSRRAEERAFQEKKNYSSEGGP